MDVTSDLAHFIIETQPESIPETILHEGKRCIINFIAAAIHASRDSSLQILLDIFSEEGGQSRASILGNGTQTSLQNAALANGYLGHFDDYDDTHFPTILHPSSPTIPAALAVAEYHGISGRDFLTATVSYDPVILWRYLTSCTPTLGISKLGMFHSYFFIF